MFRPYLRMLPYLLGFRPYLRMLPALTKTTIRFTLVGCLVCSTVDQPEPLTDIGADPPNEQFIRKDACDAQLEPYPH